MMSDKEMFIEVNKLIKKHVPKWKTVAKSDSFIHKVIGFFADPLIGYSKYFWTTIGFTTAYPDGDGDGWLTLCHEGKHGIQNRQLTRGLFSFLYLCPQILFPIIFGVLGLILSPWYYLGMLGTFIPFPAPYRAYSELKAYQISIMLAVWVINKDYYTKNYIDRIAEYLFAGPSYFWMWPFKDQIKNQLYKAVDTAEHWEELRKKDPYISDLYLLLKSSNRLSYKRNK